MLSTHSSIQRVGIKGVALTLLLLLVVSFMPARAALAIGTAASSDDCTLTATVTQSGSYVRAGGISNCPTAVPVHAITVAYSVDFARVDSASKTCYNTTSCAHELPARLKVRGGHTYCSEVSVFMLTTAGLTTWSAPGSGTSQQLRHWALRHAESWQRR